MSRQSVAIDYQLSTINYQLSTVIKSMFLVTGATSGLGRRIVRQLRDSSQSVRAFVRLSANYEELEAREAEVFIGDLRQDKDIRKACRGIQYIISCHSNSGDPQIVDYRANIELIDRAKENAVEHFVFISVLGAERNYQESPTFKAKREVEKYLVNSGLNYTILRPSGFASNLLPLAERFRDTGIYLLLGNGKNRSSIVSTDDLAKMAIASVAIESAKNKILPVGGPDILKLEEIPQIFSRVFNRQPIVINPPLLLFDALRSPLELLNPQIGENLGSFRTLLANEFFCTADEIANLESIYNFQLESLESFLRRYL